MLHRIHTSGDGDEVVVRPPGGRGDVAGFAIGPAHFAKIL